MKEVFIMRHGKAANYLEYDYDFDRPLVKRGEREVERAVKDLKKYTAIDEIISSPAKRTLMTSRIAADVLEIPDAQITTVNDLYDGVVSTYIEAINNSTSKKILIVGHNPNIAQLAIQYGKEGWQFKTSEIFGFLAHEDDIEKGCVVKTIFTHLR